MENETEKKRNPCGSRSNRLGRRGSCVDRLLDQSRDRRWYSNREEAKEKRMYVKKSTRTLREDGRE